MQNKRAKMLRSLSVLLLFAHGLYGQSGAEENTEKFIALNPEDRFTKYYFFDAMTLYIPESVKQKRKNKPNPYDIVSLKNKRKDLWFQIRKKEGYDLSLVKKIHEEMATSTYKGEIHRSEIIEINGREVYVIDMTGYWNESEVKESWTKFYAVNDGYYYQCLMKYPEADRLGTIDYRNEIINSLKLEE